MEEAALLILVWEEEEVPPHGFFVEQEAGSKGRALAQLSLTNTLAEESHVSMHLAPLCVSNHFSVLLNALVFP